MGRFQLESIYLYFPPSSQLLYNIVYQHLFLFIFVHPEVDILIMPGLVSSLILFVKEEEKRRFRNLRMIFAIGLLEYVLGRFGF